MPRLEWPPVSEAGLERACSELLEWDGWRSLKTDPVSRREWGKGFGEKGMADRLYLRYPNPEAVKLASEILKRFQDEKVNARAEVMWIEWKRPPGPRSRAGGRLKPHQVEWIKAERARGALVLVAGQDFERSYEDFLRWYRASGLMRKEGL